MKGLIKLGSARQARGGERNADRIERVAAPSQTGWDMVLVWFMRLVALLWLAKGVWSWMRILDVWPNAAPFEDEPFGRQTVIVYFSVIDFTAAVGLWLTSAWGGVVWLLAATSAITLALLTPQLLAMSMPLIAIQGSIVVIYFILSSLAANEAR
ncbi:hypothetical protein ASG40_01395 [Methylobacterium sp. Leaf399]|uniref:DUF6163 family protein n=1 Tax=unclassified Methylobacterium TaxID=2615210 RepID=UPI0006F7FD3F|nr:MULTISPECIES: DUF6163 family protein [unclassified Methylobacterium]KQP61375.1 hypothetical protein ASF39_01400 [Methylobacterium sp. Leaf108]KQT19523.1 hypothetical protein ASG40_01395 [Methylobacterium sp. Leaf399]KQT80576.1 hypothetical protein ASG59_03830 [Methylobacterium sp. Leaf466]